MKSKGGGSFESGLRLIRQSLGADRVRFDEPLVEHAYLETSAVASGFYIATTQLELIKALDLCFELRVPYFILGSGTKSIISDKGFKGLVIKNRTANLKIMAFKGKVSVSGLGVEEATVEVESGVSLGKLNQFLMEQKLKPVDAYGLSQSTIGSLVFVDPIFKELAENVKIWDQGDVSVVQIFELKRVKDVVLSVSLKVKAKA